MRITAALTGSLTQFMEAEIAKGKAAVTDGIREVADSLKNEMRKRTRQQGIADPIPNTWRAENFPKAKGRKSLDAAAIVYSKAPKIAGAFERPAQIAVQGGGKYLAIPTQFHPAYGRRRRRNDPPISPRTFPTDLYGELVFVRRPQEPHLLIVRTARLLAGGKAAAGLTRKGNRRKDAQSVPMFFLYSRTRLNKRIDFDGAIRQAEAQIDGLIVRKWDALDAGQ